jgi:Homeodomain-like domain
LHTLRHAPPLQRDWHGGDPPEWQPRFSGKQIREARAVARQHTGRHAEVQRARLALLLYRHPEMTSPEAARRVGQSASWVYKWRRRWVSEGFTLEDLPRPGRARVFSPSGPRAGDRGCMRVAESA